MFRTRLVWLAGVLILAAACARPVTPLPEVAQLAPTPPPAISFPVDAGPHDALTEWWYFTGHLTSDADGRTYGFEYTVFQVRREGSPTGYLVHFAVSDIAVQGFSHQARVLQGDPFTGFPLYVDGWSLGTDGVANVIDAVMQAGPGADRPFGVRLRLTDEKPPVLHHGGYIEYGPAGGSYYYSRTRLAVTGSLTSGDAAPVRVSGLAWMDHQWGNFVITTAGGWDWYSLQLDDRSELMLYVLRGPDGSTTSVYGTQVNPDGTTRDVAPGSVSAEAVGSWTSPHTGAEYPSGWRVQLPNGERLELTPQLVDQELYFPSVGSQMSYWEGAVSVSGDRTGVGYVELTGYAPPDRLRLTSDF